MNKILFVDCDRTIRKPKSGAKFINSPTDQEAIPGAIKAIENAQNKGFLIIGITNQPGVAAGHKSLENCIKEQQYTLELFPQIEAIYFCPDFEGKLCYLVRRNSCEQRYKWRDDINFRKPGDGMIFRAFIDYNGGDYYEEAWMIGDRPEDEQAATSAGISFMDADIWRERWQTGEYRV